MWPFGKAKADDESQALTAYDVARWHFGELKVDQMTIQERTFPFRVRADLQRALEEVLAELKVLHACGVQAAYHEAAKLADCLAPLDRHMQARCAPPQFQEVDVGDELPVRCQNSGLWMLESEGEKLALLMAPAGMYDQVTGLRIELAGKNLPAIQPVMQGIFRRLEEAVTAARSYRGKILSLEQHDHDYTGLASGITVHRLREVDREQVILPEATLQLLDRNIVEFIRQRAELKRRGLSTRKGLLFYGPPGTGKTHTIHYLTRALPGHTTLIVTAEQVGLLEHYMTLARLLQPSIVVMEDVDLIARNRERMESACEEVLLNKLLNHMDGLKEDADVLFVLTTNRPETLEPALAARPGRIDQAIEFPLPDDDGRRRLVRMYAAGVEAPDAVAGEIVRRTKGVSAAFIKELMRRSYQFHLERSGTGRLSVEDVDAALDEMLFRGGPLNRVLLGAGGAGE